MSTLDPLEEKLARWALILAAAAGLGSGHLHQLGQQGHQDGKNSISVAPDAWLSAGVILILCALAAVALWKKKRTLSRSPSS